MKQVQKHTITIEPQNEQYNYSRQTTITLSEEFFNEKEVGKITAMAFTAATRNGASINVSSTALEVPADVEEGFKVKAEKLEKDLAEKTSALNAKTRELMAAEIKRAVENEGYNADVPDEYKHAILAELDKISSTWERDNVKKVLVTDGTLDKD